MIDTGVLVLLTAVTVVITITLLSLGMFSKKPHLAMVLVNLSFKLN